MGLVNRFPNRGDLYGMLAFAGTGLAAFSIFPFASRIGGEMSDLIATFVLGGAYILLGSFSRYLIDDRPVSRAWRYLALQTALVFGAIFSTPLAGFFLIILLPLVSQVIFIYRWYFSLVFGLSCYLTSTLVYYPRFGFEGMFEALVSYSPAYLFTMVFSYVTRDALAAREHAMSLKEKLETANAQLRAQAEQTAELATTRERNRLAREIHDGVGHYLTVINVQIEAAQTLLTSQPARAAEAMTKATRLSQEALEDVRRSVGSLRSDDERPPLMESLRELSQDAGVPVDIQVSGEPRPLASAANHALYRAAQEGLTNIRKHAAAKQSWIRIDFANPARTRLTVEDDGRGKTTSNPASGFGLRGMRERIELLGGTVTATNRTGGGFSLSVEVPA
jgi:signal transduction histidine kinase